MSINHRLGRVVLFDVDGPCGDFGRHTLTRLKGCFDFDSPTQKEIPTYEKINKWGYFEEHPNQSIRFQVDKMWNDPDFWLEMPVVPGAQEAVEKFRSKGYHVVFVSSRREECYGWTDVRHEWLMKHFGPGLHKRLSFIPTHIKYFVNGDIMIDDKPQNLIEWYDQSRINRVDVLWEEPWNKKYPFVDTKTTPCMKIKEWNDNNVHMIIERSDEVRHYTDHHNYEKYLKSQRRKGK